MSLEDWRQWATDLGREIENVMHERETTQHDSAGMDFTIHQGDSRMSLQWWREWGIDLKREIRRVQENQQK